MLEIGIIIAIILSAFFAGSETVFLSFSKVRLPGWMHAKVKGASRVEFLLHKPERFLVTTLTGNTVVNVAYSSLMAIFLTQRNFSEQTILILAPLILVIFGETLPKSFARQLADYFILKTGLFLYLSRWLLFPIAYPVEMIVRKIQQQLNLSEDDMGRMLSRAEIKSALDEAQQSGDLPSASQPLLRGMLEFETRTAKDITTPRTSVIAVELNTQLDQARQLMIESGFSHLPVYRGHLDDVFGMIIARDVLIAKKDIRSILTTLKTVPESLSLVDLLRWFKKEKTDFAGVIDEYGGFAGVVTVEDIVEEMFGPIDDEFDSEYTGIWQINDRTWLTDGRTRISHIGHRTGFNPNTSCASIGGFISEHLGNIPLAGTIVNLPEAELRVIKADPRGVKLVRITLKTESMNAEYS